MSRGVARNYAVPCLHITDSFHDKLCRFLPEDKYTLRNEADTLFGKSTSVLASLSSFSSSSGQYVRDKFELCGIQPKTKRFTKHTNKGSNVALTCQFAASWERVPAGVNVTNPRWSCVCV